MTKKELISALEKIEKTNNAVMIACVPISKELYLLATIHWWQSFEGWKKVKQAENYKETPLTLKKALALGYTLAGSQRQRGYVSRKHTDHTNDELQVAGGSRKGQLYYLKPCHDSSQYCWRQYLVAPDNIS